MPATNDPFVSRYRLPGVVEPKLPNDIVNKEYLDKRENLSFVLLHNHTIDNTTVLQDTALVVTIPPGSGYRLSLFGLIEGGAMINQCDIKCAFTLGGSAITEIWWQYTNRDSQPNVNRGSGTASSTPLQNGNQGRIAITGTVMNVDHNLSAPLTFQFAQQTAINTDLTLKAYSSMFLSRMYGKQD